MIWHRKERGDTQMCKKIREVNSLTPERVLEKHWDGKIPVNVKKILSSVDVRFREYDITNLEEILGLDKNDAVLGMAFSDGDNLGILFSTRIDKDATNYVLAHEFAHCCLHMRPSEKFHIEMKLSRDLYSWLRQDTILGRYRISYKEIEADRFAADLLIPTKALLDLFINGSDQSIDGIAKHFHVSKEIVRLKIINLKKSRFKVGVAK